jgi:hypothetical protein
MPRKTKKRRSAARTVNAAEEQPWGQLQLVPVKVLAPVFELACSSTVPAHLLLARVNKSLGAAAAEHLEKVGFSIALDLSIASSSRQQQRRVAFVTWLRQKGHLLTGLDITIQNAEGSWGTDLMDIWNHIPDVMEALTAAAGGQTGGLVRLQRLSLPALGVTPIPTMCDTLSVCRQLRHLDLGGSDHPQIIQGITHADGAAGGFRKRLPDALAALAQLTSLRLHAHVFAYFQPSLPSSPSSTGDSLDALVTALPRGLLHLDLGGSQGSRWPVSVCASSLRHLVHLQQLSLSCSIQLTTTSNSSNSSTGSSSRQASALTALTALTSLDYAGALVSTPPPEGPHGGEGQGDAYPLLYAPNLVALTTDRRADPAAMQLLASNAAGSLRSLACCVAAGDGPSAGPALAQLTGLTSLELLLVHDGGGGWQEDHVQAWGVTLLQLTRLRRLKVTAALLLHQDLAGFTALTHLHLDAVAARKDTMYTRDSLLELMGRLGPLARGVLREVGWEGVRPGWREDLRFAAAAMGGGAQLVFY